MFPASSPPTVSAAKKVGLAASRDGHFIFWFVAPKLHGHSSIKSKKRFLTLIFVFYLQIFDIAFALQRKSRFTLEGWVIKKDGKQSPQGRREKQKIWVIFLRFTSFLATSTSCRLSNLQVLACIKCYFVFPFLSNTLEYLNKVLFCLFLARSCKRQKLRIGS